MKIENLKVGMKFNSLKDMCLFLEVKYKDNTNSRNKIKKEIGRYAELSFKGRVITVIEIHANIKVKIENRGISKGSRGNAEKEFSQLQILEYQFNSIGIYSIILDNNIYIGSTVLGFKQRFLGHNCKSNKLKTLQMLNNGALFEIVEICDGIDEFSIRKMETEYIQLYKKDINWNIINVNDAWSYQPHEKKTKKPKKIKYKTLKLKLTEENYNKAIQLLEENNIIEKENITNI